MAIVCRGQKQVNAKGLQNGASRYTKPLTLGHALRNFCYPCRVSHSGGAGKGGNHAQATGVIFTSTKLPPAMSITLELSDEVTQQTGSTPGSRAAA